MVSIVEEAKKRFLGSLLDDTIGYWRVYDRLKLKVLSNVAEKRADFRSENEFWYSILGDRFAGPKPKKFVAARPGQVVRFKDCFASDWVPKLPGRAWTVDGVQDLQEGLRHVAYGVEVDNQMHVILGPLGKEKVLAAGYGSVRLNPGVTNSDWYTCLSLTTAGNWQCDLGIPLVVSKPVYEEFARHGASGAPWIESIEGILHIGEDLPLKELLPAAIGAKLPDGLDSILRFRPFLPKCFVYVSSPLNVQFRYNDSHPTCTAWTVFERRHDQRLRYTYTKFDPSEADSTRDAVEFINQYVRRFDGKRILVDFDGREPKLEAAVRLKTDPLRSRKSVSVLKEVLQGIGDWSRG
jgi:hypothetical protein